MDAAYSPLITKGTNDVPCRLSRLISDRFIQRPFEIWLEASV